MDNEINKITGEIEEEANSAYMGEDFLTWLWFKSEKNNSVFKDGEGEEFYLTFEDKIVVSGGEGDFKESAISSGKNSSFREARYGLRTGKKVVKARIRIEYAGEEWSFQVNGEDFSFSSFKTPKIASKEKGQEDEEGAFFEKLFLMDRALEFFDHLFLEFMKLRNDPRWEEEKEEIKRWIFDSEEEPFHLLPH